MSVCAVCIHRQVSYRTAFPICIEVVIDDSFFFFGGGGGDVKEEWDRLGGMSPLEILSFFHILPGKLVPYNQVV